MMTASRPIAAAFCLAAFLANKPAAAQAAAAPDTSLTRAENCVASLPPFGGRGANYLAPNGTIQMGNDGGWCWLSIGWVWRGDQVVPQAKLVFGPLHGAVQIAPVDGMLRVAYKPAPGYIGRDLFKVLITGFGEKNKVPVHVTVVQ
jgi:hypothetical protein